MKWTYSIKNKLTASGALFSLCVLVLFSNYLDRTHTENVKKAISTLYEDRLIAEEFILKMTSGFYQIKEVINSDSTDVIKINSVHNLIADIVTVSNAYQKTKFTTAETSKADELLLILKAFESDIHPIQVKLEFANKALVILNELSAIQLAESKQIMDHAEELYLSGKTSSQFVFVIIVIILIVLQALVFTSKSLVSNTKFPNLN
ncbi:MCP four helix bundle domain-containing protein [Flavobacterium lacus]|uniref:Chemoreceptor-like protein with four helix bundle sensory module n=1 Tax=Flavobacterium lacus TaxID=1353778 RepID=A0A328WQ83_9FLAO|nr:hypothetical protein [Flavobacterium lacus]RAR46517.1 hypothetical protein B0I10_11712 [Flavobacterium lacus]